MAERALIGVRDPCADELTGASVVTAKPRPSSAAARIAAPLRPPRLPTAVGIALLKAWSASGALGCPILDLRFSGVGAPRLLVLPDLKLSDMLMSWLTDDQQIRVGV